MLEVSESEAQALKEQAKLAPADAVSRLMEVLTDCESRLRDAVSKKILIEVTLLKAIQALNAVSLDAVLKQLRQLRAEDDGPESGGPVEPPATPAKVPLAQAAAPAARLRRQAQTAPQSPADLRSGDETIRTSAAAEAGSGSTSADTGFEGQDHLGERVAVAAMGAAQTKGLPSDGGADAVDYQSLWMKVVEAVGRVSQFTRSYLLQAHPISFSGKVLVIGFDPEFADHIDLVDNPKNRTLIQTKLKELAFGEVQIKFVKAEAPATPTVQPATFATVRLAPSVDPQAETAATSSVPAPEAPPPKPNAARTSEKESNQDDFRNDPLIKEALEIFKGQIVEIRG
jgi:hypothetical protein